MKSYIIDRFVEDTDAVIGINDLALQRGFAVFDFFRTHEGAPVFLDDHLKRFFRSATQLHLQGLPDINHVKALIETLMDMNKIENSGVRMMFTGGYSADGYRPATSNLILVQKPLRPDVPAFYENGIKLISHVYQRELPFIKSINYLMGVWMQQKMDAEAADDVVYHFEGKLSELPRSNIFMVNHSNEVLTPRSNVLPGITRQKILSLSGKAWNIKEADFSMETLKAAKEVFVTSTTKKIMPVRQIDDVVIGNGEPGTMTKKLSTAFLELVG